MFDVVWFILVTDEVYKSTTSDRLFC